MRKCPILNGRQFPLGVLGINHKSASLTLRESLAEACERRFAKDHQVPLVLLSTCNRTELYYSSDDLPIVHHELLQELRSEVECEFEHALYSYFGSDTFHHLAKVTSGIDSAVLGETEIQGQVKNAYEQQQGGLNKELHFAFQKSLKIGKEIRTSYLIEKGMPSLEGATYKFGEMVLGEANSREVLFVGASEINRKVLRYLKLRGVESLTLCNRTAATAAAWAEEEGVAILPWEQLGEWQHFDWVIVGTKASDYILNDSQPIIKQKRLLIDLSLPRNIDPRLGQQTDTLLLNIDQINHSVDDQTVEMRTLVRGAELRIREQVNRQLALFSQREQRRLAFA